MRRLALIGAIVVALTAVVVAQTTVHPGRVIVRSVAADALTVVGGVVAASSLATVVDAGVGTVPILATFERTGAVGSTTTRGVALAFKDADSATLTAAIAGLRPNSNGNFNGDLGFYVSTGGASPATSIAVGMTRRMTITSAGQVLVDDGTAAVPSYSFATDTDTGLYLSAPNVITIATAGSAISEVAGTADTTRLTLATRALGTGVIGGAALVLGRNTSGSGAPGVLRPVDKVGVSWSIWPDSSGNLRIGSTVPTESSGDTIGTVVGTQTSTAASKHILAQVGGPVATGAAMRIIRATPIYQFTYKNGAYNGETFYGITTDSSPLFGMDAGKSFNPVNAFGATVLAMQDLDARVHALEARLRALEGRR